MAQNSFSVTYEIVTPESAENGEAEETGFELESGSLRDCWEIVRWGCSGGVEPNEWPMQSPSWVTFYDVETNYATAEVKSYSVHFPRNITPSSARRVAKFLGAR